MKRRAAGLVLLIMSAAASVHAAEVGYEINAGVGESDNIRRTSNDEESGSIGSAGVELSWIEKREHLDGDVTANLDYVDYLDNTYDSEVVGNLIGQVTASFVPKRLLWSVSDNFGQSRVNPLIAVTPDNRENINFFSTGPDVRLPLGAITLLTLGARYSNVHYETSPFDNDRVSGSMGLLRNLSEASRVSLNLRGERIEFDETDGGVDYDRREAYLRYDAKGHRTKLGVDLGYSQLKPDDIEDTSGIVARLQLSRQLTPSSVLAASFGHEYSDAGSSFLLQQTLGGAGAGTQSGAQSSNPFTNDYVTLAWNFDRRRTGLGFNVARFDESYRQLATLDRTRWQAGAEVRRDLTPTLRATLLGAYAREDFENIVGDSREISASAILTWRPGQHWSLSLQFDRLTRDSDIPTSEYQENRGWLRIAFGRQAPVQPGPVIPPLPSESNF